MAKNPMVPGMMGGPSSTDRPEAPRVMFNRNRGGDMKGHGREGNMGGSTDGPDYRQSGIESTSRQPC